MNRQRLKVLLLLFFLGVRLACWSQALPLCWRSGRSSALGFACLALYVVPGWR